jgi:hypothetical protein
MIKVGNILINYDSIDTVVRTSPGDKPSERGVETIQIIYKSGVVKNIKSCELGMNCEEFIKELEKINKRTEDKKLLRLSLMFNQNK